MNQVMGQQQNMNNQHVQADSVGNTEPGQIKLQVRIFYGSAGTAQMQLALDETTPFFIVVTLIKQNLFAQNMPSQFEEGIQYIIHGITYKENEQQTLKDLHVDDNSTVDVKLQYKGGRK